VSIIWNENLITGVAVIDEQHQCFIEKMNKIKELKFGDEGFCQFLIDLQDFLVLHFQTEENYMIDLDYPDYASHKKSHDNALLNYKTYLTRIVDDSTVKEIATILIDYIGCWFKEHYLNDDIKMAAYLKHNFSQLTK